MNDLIYSYLKQLKQKNIPNPELDLRILIKESLFEKKDITLSNVEIKNINLNFFKKLINKRLNRVPISKIIKKKDFWKSEFFVNSSVLDPRPETEFIIEEVLNNIKNKNKDYKILDIGTGSGCLAISLAQELKNSNITAIDISKRALKVAEKNIISHKLSNRIKLKLLDFKNIKSKFDIIISNPPYINHKEYKELQLEVRKYEPKIALLGGKNGLKFYKMFAKKIEKNMYKNSLFICEIGHSQLDDCIKIFSKTNLILKNITKDLHKIDRTLTFFNI